MHQLSAIGFLSYPEDISTEDKISLCIAEKYLDFKVCCNVIVTRFIKIYPQGGRGLV